METLDPNHWLHFFRPTHLLSSPKTRCQQTLVPLANALDLSVTICGDLDERHANETSHDFNQRIHQFVSQLEKRFPPTSQLALCSHYDWLAEFITIVPSDILEPETIQHFSPGEAHGFQLENGCWLYQGPRSWA
jgi:broad specificity phosphatase PhoE